MKKRSKLKRQMYALPQHLPFNVCPLPFDLVVPETKFKTQMANVQVVVCPVAKPGSIASILCSSPS
jgi:hypothetical protein